MQAAYDRVQPNIDRRLNRTVLCQDVLATVYLKASHTQATRILIQLSTKKGLILFVYFVISVLSVLEWMSTRQTVVIALTHAACGAHGTVGPILLPVSDAFDTELRRNIM